MTLVTRFDPPVDYWLTASDKDRITVKAIFDYGNFMQVETPFGKTAFSEPSRLLDLRRRAKDYSEMQALAKADGDAIRRMEQSTEDKRKQSYINEALF